MINLAQHVLQNFFLLFSKSLDLNEENLHLSFSQAFCFDRYRDVSL